MTRHTYRPGDAIDPGATYYPMDGARQRDPLEPEDVIAALDAWENAKPLSDAIDAARQALDGRCSCTTEECRCQPKAEHWSPWLPWKGGPCPLPGDTPVDTRSRREIEEYVWRAGKIYWGHDRPDESCRPHVVKFRYRSPDPAGWLPRGDWIPPAELWDEGCPVRLHIRTDNGGEGWAQHYPRDWDGITHIRLIAREAQAGLPEGWSINEDGTLVVGVMRTFNRTTFDLYGAKKIDQAVDAWLREMGDE